MEKEEGYDYSFDKAVSMKREVLSAWVLHLADMIRGWRAQQNDSLLPGADRLNRKDAMERRKFTYSPSTYFDQSESIEKRPRQEDRDTRLDTN